MAGEFSPQVRADIILRDGECCGICGRYAIAGHWSIQHRRARGAGGSKKPDTGSVQNGILLCGSATTGDHFYVESHPSWALAMGYRIPQGVDPATVPVWTARHGWVFLTRDGRYEPTTDPHPDETAVLEAASRIFLERTT